MATLQEQFEQAVSVSRARPPAPNPQARASQERLEQLYREATGKGAPDNEDAMRQFIELAGDQGQQAD